MAGKIEERLNRLSIELPQPGKPGANFVPFAPTGGLAFLTGQLSQWNGDPVSLQSLTANLQRKKDGKPRGWVRSISSRKVKSRSMAASTVFFDAVAWLDSSTPCPGSSRSRKYSMAPSMSLWKCLEKPDATLAWRWASVRFLDGVAVKLETIFEVD